MVEPQFGIAVECEEEVVISQSGLLHAEFFSAPEDQLRCSRCPAPLFRPTGRCAAAKLRQHCMGWVRDEHVLDLDLWRKSRDTLWTEGPRLDSGRVGAAVVWWEGAGWEGRSYYLGRNKGAYDAEIYTIYRALRITDQLESVYHLRLGFGSGLYFLRQASALR